MHKTVRKFGAPQWLWWTLVTIAAVTASATSLLVVDRVIPGFPFVFFNSTAGFYVYFLIIGTLFGAVLGVAQWFVLRVYIHRAGWWVLASVIGMAIGNPAIHAVYQTSLALGGPYPNAIGLIGPGYGIEALAELGIRLLAFAVAGTILGFAQCLVLRMSVGRAAWWPLGSALAWAAATSTRGISRAVIGPAAYAFFPGLHDLQSIYSRIMFVFLDIESVGELPLLGFLVGGITGLSLLGLLNRPTWPARGRDRWIGLSSPPPRRSPLEIGAYFPPTHHLSFFQQWAKRILARLT